MKVTGTEVTKLSEQSMIQAMKTNDLSYGGFCKEIARRIDGGLPVADYHAKCAELWRR